MSKRENIAFMIFPKTLIKNIHPYEVVWPLSAGIMATILKREGFNTTIIDFRIEEFDLNKIIKYTIENDIDILFIKYETRSLSISLDFSKRIKKIKKNLIVVGFGQHAIALPQDIIKEGGADICITTDPEFVVKNLIYAIKNSELRKLNNIVYKNRYGEFVVTNKDEPDFDVDSLPYIDLSLLKISHYRKKKFPKPFFWGRNWGFIRTSFGCPYKCIFCSPLLRYSVSKVFRCHSIDYVLNQIRYYKEVFGIKIFSIEDDAFSFDEERAENLCSFIKHLKIKWVVEGARADNLSKKLLEKMKEAGCVGIGLGIESGSNRVLGILKKGETKFQIRKTAYNIKKLRMMLAGYIIIGNPTETEEDLEKTFKLIEEINPLILYIHYFVPYPGSEAYNIYRDKISVRNISHYTYSGINLTEVDTEKLKSFMKYFYKRYYLSWRYIKEYIKQRLKYAVFDIDEWMLVKNALKFIISK